MKTLLPLALLVGIATTHAAVVKFDLSPAGTDNAIGLSPLNEVPAVTNSLGSGNEIGPGITFDTDTLKLNLAIGYGSAFGFENLTGPLVGEHIHGPAPTNTIAPIVINLASNTVPAADGTNGGVILGDVQLTTEQASNLVAGLYYINLHTALNPSGELRAQLIPMNTMPALVCPPPVTVECMGPNGTFASLTAQVSDADGDPLSVIWSVNGVDIQTNQVPAGGATNLTDVTFDAYYQDGTNMVQISVSDGVWDPVTCDTSVTVVDTEPPVIHRLAVTPCILWPPNHKMRLVRVTAVASDSCDPNPTCKITSIRSSEPVRAKGDKTAPDWVITGDLTARLRAERQGNGDGRVYTLTVTCTDASGNSTNGVVTVTVPHDQRARKALEAEQEAPQGNSKSKSHGKKD